MIVRTAAGSVQVDSFHIVAVEHSLGSLRLVMADGIAPLYLPMRRGASLSELAAAFDLVAKALEAERSTGKVQTIELTERQ